MIIPGNSWLKRYLDSPRWIMVREDSVVWDMKKYFPYDWEHKIWIMQVGLMSVTTKYAEYMWLSESIEYNDLPS